MANNAIILLEQLQSEALSAQSTDDVAHVTSDYNAAQASNQLPTQADIVNAQQDRTTLQARMSATNAQAAAGLQQCNAIH